MASTPARRTTVAGKWIPGWSPCENPSRAISQTDVWLSRFAPRRSQKQLGSQPSLEARQHPRDVCGSSFFVLTPSNSILSPWTSDQRSAHLVFIEVQFLLEENDILSLLCG